MRHLLAVSVLDLLERYSIWIMIFDLRLLSNYVVKVKKVSGLDLTGNFSIDIGKSPKSNQNKVLIRVASDPEVDENRRQKIDKNR